MQHCAWHCTPTPKASLEGSCWKLFQGTAVLGLSEHSGQISCSDAVAANPCAAQMGFCPRSSLYIRRNTIVPQTWEVEEAASIWQMLMEVAAKLLEAAEKLLCVRVLEELRLASHWELHQEECSWFHQYQGEPRQASHVRPSARSQIWLQIWKVDGDGGCDGGGGAGNAAEQGWRSCKHDGVWLFGMHPLAVIG